MLTWRIISCCLCFKRSRSICKDWRRSFCWQACRVWLLWIAPAGCWSQLCGNIAPDAGVLWRCVAERPITSHCNECTNGNHNFGIIVRYPHSGDETTYEFADRTTKWYGTGDWWNKSRPRLYVPVPIRQVADQVNWTCCSRLQRPLPLRSPLRPFFVDLPMSWCALNGCKIASPMSDGNE